MDSWDGNWRWYTLVHVCRRWRHIVLTSSRRLDLQLFCTTGTSVEKYLGCWPPTLPIAIKFHFPQFYTPHPEDVRNVFIALENPDRVCSIELYAPNSLLEQLSRAMQVPFPALKNLSLQPMDFFDPVPIISQNFFGGSAPGLQKFSLSGGPFSALPDFLLSCKDLVDLQLSYVPNPNEILPEVMVTSLSNLSRLKILSIRFIGTFTSTLRHSRNSHVPRLTLSALSEFTFAGCGEYLEDLLARIDTPFVQRFIIEIRHRFYNAPQLCRLLCHTEGLRSPNQARIIKLGREVNLLCRQVGRSTGSPMVECPPVTIKNCNISLSFQEWQPSVAQFRLQLTPLLSGVKCLTVELPADQALRQDEDWLDLFLPFSAVEEFYVSRRLGSPIAFALAGATRQAEILPALRSVFFEEAEESPSLMDTIKPFLAARGLSH